MEIKLVNWDCTVVHGPHHGVFKCLHHREREKYRWGKLVGIDSFIKSPERRILLAKRGQI